MYTDSFSQFFGEIDFVMDIVCDVSKIIFLGSVSRKIVYWPRFVRAGSFYPF